MTAFTLSQTITPELVEDLKKSFPNQLPTKVVSESELNYLVGQQSVVNYIVDLFEQQIGNHVSKT